MMAAAMVVIMLFAGSCTRKYMVIREPAKMPPPRMPKNPFIAMAGDIIHGNPVAIEPGPVAPAVNASCAIPGLFVPVKMYGMTLGWDPEQCCRGCCTQ